MQHSNGLLNGKPSGKRSFRTHSRLCAIERGLPKLLLTAQSPSPVISIDLKRNNLIGIALNVSRSRWTLSPPRWAYHKECSWGASKHVTKFYYNVAWHTTKFAGISIYPYLLMVCCFVMIITSEPQRMDDSRVQASQNDTWNKHKAMPHQTKGIHKLFWPHINTRVVNHFFSVLPKLKNHSQDPWASDDHL